MYSATTSDLVNIIFLTSMLGCVGFVLILGKRNGNKELRDRDTINTKLIALFGGFTETPNLLDDTTQILNLRTVSYDEDRSAVQYVKCEVIARKFDHSYWLAFVYSDDRQTYLEEIGELRARRALFLHPSRYLCVFGVKPHRDQIKPLVSMQEKLDNFDPKMHGAELHLGSPVGKEFGSQAP